MRGEDGSPISGSGRGAVRWSIAAFLLALSASVVLLVAPLGTQVEATTSPAHGSSAPPEPSASKVTHPSQIESEGWSVAVPLSIPVALTAIGLVATRYRSRPVMVGLAVLLGGFVVLGALSVGIFYLPAAVALIVVAVKGGRS